MQLHDRCGKALGVIRHAHAAVLGGGPPRGAPGDRHGQGATVTRRSPSLKRRTVS
jgi:hypothetical protein